MKIYLVRHGIASERIGGAILNDSMRPLTDEGRVETKAVVTGLKKLGVKPDLIVASPLVRARQTAEIFKEVLLVQSDMVICDALAPGGMPAAVFKFLQAQIKNSGNIDSIALFGHEPDVGHLAATLIGAEEIEIPFKKAGVCRVDVSSIPPTSPGYLKWFVTPKIAAMLAE